MGSHQDNNTSLMWAARMGDADIIRILLEAGASIEEEDDVRDRKSVV